MEPKQTKHKKSEKRTPAALRPHVNGNPTERARKFWRGLRREEYTYGTGCR